MIPVALHNGIPTSAVAPTDRGLAYGDGLFETIKVDAGRAQFLIEHLRRLERDAARLDISLDGVELRREIAALLALQRNGILKIIISRAATGRGYSTIRQAPAERLLLFYPQSFAVDQRSRLGVAVRICRHALAEQRALAGMKHLNRLEQVAARAEWTNAAIAEGLMLDSAGRLVEGTMSNIFLASGNVVKTPRLHRCGVAGIIREVLLRRLSTHAVTIVENDLLLDDLYAADEVFLTNSVIGIWPVRKIECLYKPVGEITLALQQALAVLIAHEGV